MAEAKAHSNIALIKYWGKLEQPGNFPAVPSLSLTLDGLSTTTRVTLDERLTSDQVELDGEPAVGRARDRVVAMLDEFRRLAGDGRFAHVASRNDFPTAAGLASSASGFAALATAANAAFGTALDRSRLSALARAASASAARSLFGGWSVLEVGESAAAELAPADHWPLVLLVAITASGRKSVGSTEAMNRTRSTSPFYPTWVLQAPSLFVEAKNAVMARDLARLGTAMEQSTLMMHATMLAARPAVIYFAPGTLNVMKEVTVLRTRGIPCYFTTDAGPHVKVLCHANDGPKLRAILAGIDGVIDVISAEPGPGARVVVSP
jgi:diphosphomevalonate decarboxylase